MAEDVRTSLAYVKKPASRRLCQTTTGNSGHAVIELDCFKSILTPDFHTPFLFRNLKNHHCNGNRLLFGGAWPISPMLHPFMLSIINRPFCRSTRINSFWSPTVRNRTRCSTMQTVASSGSKEMARTRVCRTPEARRAWCLGTADSSS